MRIWRTDIKRMGSIYSPIGGQYRRGLITRYVAFFPGVHPPFPQILEQLYEPLFADIWGIYDIC